MAQRGDRLVASRLTEKYYRPAVVLTKSSELITGSARSVTGFDIYKAIESCRDLLENFGGHTYAAGLSLKEENLDAFTQRFLKLAADEIIPEQMTPQIDIDAVLDLQDINSKFMSELKKMNPFGPDNQKPVFCSLGGQGLRDQQTGRERLGTYQTGTDRRQIEHTDTRDCFWHAPT